jgi:thiamine kinase-like enzyme
VRRAVVRIGDDIPVHQIMRFNELAASRAAHAAGVSPGVIHHEPGALVIDFVEGRTMTAADLRDQDLLEQALALVMHAHRDIPRHLRGPALTFWVFQVLRDYAATLREGRSRHREIPARASGRGGPSGTRRRPDRDGLRPQRPSARQLPARRHRMWLIDWDYAGWGSPLFDLGGLAANVGLDRRRRPGCWVPITALRPMPRSGSVTGR